MLLIIVTKEDSTDDGSRGKDWRGQVGFSADHGQRTGLFGINAFREQTPRHVRRLPIVPKCSQCSLVDALQLSNLLN